MNEFVHENGHAVHMMALRTRPAFMDLGDAVFYEAFADVPPAGDLCAGRRDRVPDAGFSPHWAG